MSTVTPHQLERMEKKLDEIIERISAMSEREAACSAKTNERLLGLERGVKWIFGIVAGIVTILFAAVVK